MKSWVLSAAKSVVRSKGGRSRGTRKTKIRKMILVWAQFTARCHVARHGEKFAIYDALSIFKVELFVNKTNSCKSYPILENWGPKLSVKTPKSQGVVDLVKTGNMKSEKRSNFCFHFSIRRRHMYRRNLEGESGKAAALSYSNQPLWKKIFI